MANIKSQIKRNKTNEKRRKFNHSYLSSMRTAIKKVYKFIEENNKEKALEMQNYANSRIDKALKKGIVKKNFASRKKSSIALKINSITNK